MNKNKLFAACLLTGAMLCSQTASAKEDDYLAGFTDRVTEGFSNLALGVVELPKNVINISSDENILLGMTWGLLRGVFHIAGREVIGAAEFITSPFPVDRFITPGYPWERFSEDTRYFGGHIPGYWTTYGPLDDGK